MSTIELRSGRIDLETGEFLGRQGSTVLTETEVRLLAYLAARPSRDVSRDELLVEVWGLPVTSLSRCVDTAMRRLRAKLEDRPSRPQHLLTRHGHGYRFEPGSSVFEASDVGQTILGRSAQRAAVLAAIAHGDRCVTVFGPGGIGKTTLVQSLLDALPQPVSFVALQGLTDEAGVIAALARKRELPLPETTSDALVDALREARGTIVLDTAEHVAHAVLDLVSAVMSANRGLRFVVTSQRRLGMKEETVIDVPPLDPTASLTLVQRRAAQFEIELADDLAHELVDRLDGMPLALELAVGRCRTVPAEELLRRLQDRLDWLTRRGRVEDERHRTLLGALQWSWALLDEAQRQAAQQLAVFPSTFSLKAASAVLHVAGRDELDLLEDLVEASWLRRDGAWFRMLDPVRIFVNGQDEAGDARARHTAFASSLARQCLANLHGPETGPLRKELSAHVDDLEVAFDHAHHHNDAEAVGWLALALERAVGQSGPADQLRKTLERAWALREGMSDATRSRLGCVLAIFLTFRGLGGWQTALEDGVQSATRTQDSAAQGLALAYRGTVLLHARDESCEAALIEALEYCRDAGLEGWEAYTETMLAHLDWVRDETDRALLRARRARQVFARLKAHESVFRVDETLAVFTGALGRHEESLPRLRRMVEAHRDAGRARLLLLACVRLATGLLEVGKLDEASRLVDEGTQLVERLSLVSFDSDVRNLRGMIYVLQGDLEEAERELGELQVRETDRGRPSLGPLLLRAIVLRRLGRRLEAERLVVHLRDLIDRNATSTALAPLVDGVMGDPRAIHKGVAAIAVVAKRSVMIRLLCRLLTESARTR
ncbi:MAG: winged helix-turn-helix domain-containing protein [Myxococcota bacterium]